MQTLLTLLIEAATATDENARPRKVQRRSAPDEESLMPSSYQSSTSSHSPTTHQASVPSQSQASIQNADNPASSSLGSVDTSSAPPSPNAARGSKNNTRKCKWDNADYDRITFSRTSPPLPESDAKISSKSPNQLQALEWLTASTRAIFLDKHRHRLAE